MSQKRTNLLCFLLAIGLLLYPMMELTRVIVLEAIINKTFIGIVPMRDFYFELGGMWLCFIAGFAIIAYRLFTKEG